MRAVRSSRLGSSAAGPSAENARASFAKSGVSGDIDVLQGLFRPAARFLATRRERPDAVEGERIRVPPALLPILDRPRGPMPAGAEGRGVLLQGRAEGSHLLSNRHELQSTTLPYFLSNPPLDSNTAMP